MGNFSILFIMLCLKFLPKFISARIFRFEIPILTGYRFRTRLCDYNQCFRNIRFSSNGYNATRRVQIILSKLSVVCISGLILYYKQNVFIICNWKQFLGLFTKNYGQIIWVSIISSVVVGLVRIEFKKKTTIIKRDPDNT